MGVRLGIQRTDYLFRWHSVDIPLGGTVTVFEYFAL
jgi:hypothetical protein